MTPAPDTIPEPTEADVNAAYRFVDSMVPRADISYPFPAWHGWALREAYLAGLASSRRRIAELEEALRPFAKCTCEGSPCLACTDDWYMWCDGCRVAAKIAPTTEDRPDAR